MPRDIPASLTGCAFTCAFGSSQWKQSQTATPLSQPRAVLDHAWQDYFCDCAMSWLSGQVLVKDHLGKTKKEKTERKKLFFSLAAQVAEAGSWQCIQGCSHPQLLAQALVKPHLIAKLLHWGIGKSEGHAVSSLYPPWCFLTWKSIKLVQGSWKRDFVIMEMRVVPGPSIQKSWVGLAEVMRSLKIRKVVFLLILAAVLTFRVHEILNAHLLRLFRGTRLIQS